jgi:energy-coupling factor transporter transmembrane protein EcfT
VCRALILEARHRHRRNILIKAALGIAGTIITPLIAGAVATLMMFYIVIWLIVVGSAGVALHIGLIVFGIWVLFYIGLMVTAWKRERSARSFYYKTSERRPPNDLFPPAIIGPPYYIALGMDLLADDVPPHWMIRIPCFWAEIMVKAFLQWKVYRYAAAADIAPAAEIILRLAKAPGASIEVDPLVDEHLSKPMLHSALCVLMILDIAALNTDWSKVWLNSGVREELGLEANPRRNKNYKK